MYHGLQKEVLRDVLNPQNHGFVILHKADGCQQLYDDARAKRFVDQLLI